MMACKVRPRVGGGIKHHTGAWWVHGWSTSNGSWYVCEFLMIGYIIVEILASSYDVVLKSIAMLCNNVTMRNSYITGVRDVWHLLHWSTRARSGPRAECNKCHTSRVIVVYLNYCSIDGWKPHELKKVLLTIWAISIKVIWIQSCTFSSHKCMHSLSFHK